MRVGSRKEEWWSEQGWWVKNWRSSGLKDVPSPRWEEIIVLEASKVLIHNACNPFFCIRVHISVPNPNPSLETSPGMTIAATLLVDSGNTHKALRNKFAAKKAPLKHTKHAHHEITGFKWSNQTYYHTTKSFFNYGNQTFLFLIPPLKEMYNRIPWRTWIRHHRNLIDWPNFSRDSLIHKPTSRDHWQWPPRNWFTIHQTKQPKIPDRPILVNDHLVSSIPQISLDISELETMRLSRKIVRGFVF